ncbi:MAG: FAD-dependent oxidoreductase [Deltaproteobacteria bacterium]|nr:FAD-dependent oxidoreductase [Deltaproteobacteria bacterium]
MNSSRRKETKFPNLFESLKIRSTEIPNRIVMTGLNLGYASDGFITDKIIQFYTQRSKGGVGLIIVGACSIDEDSMMPGMLSAHDDQYIPGFKKLVASVKKSGVSKIGMQLNHSGRYLHSLFSGGKQPVSASNVASKLTGETPRSLNIEEIYKIQDAFVHAALRAKEAGFDVVEVLTATYLIDQFLSPVTNVREDEYGGSLENRMKFGLEVIRKVRSALGTDFPLMARISGNNFMDGGNTNHEAVIFARELEKSGVDIINVTGGWHDTLIPQITMTVPRCGFVYLARNIKKSVSIPVIASNRINDPFDAEEIIQNCEADLVAMTRALIADPDMPKKAMEGKTSQISHCIACNQGCMDNLFKRQPVSCLVNPSVGIEGDCRAYPAEKIKKILIIGGGPAGMEAALVSSLRGHEVTLIEKNDRLGGQVLLNKKIPGRAEMLTLIGDLIQNLKDMNVKIRLNCQADDKFVREMQPDAVIIATGALPIKPNIPGVDESIVIQAWDVLDCKASVGKNVVVIGGNAVGLETALYLANKGTLSSEMLHFLWLHNAESIETLTGLLSQGIKNVTVVEMSTYIGTGMGASTRWIILAELERLGVTVLRNSKAVGILPQGVQIEDNTGIRLIDADSIVLAVGSKSNNILTEEIERIAPAAHVIGDANKIGTALNAMKEGFEVGMKI